VDSAHEPVPDSELWRRAAEHDGAAFGELFERHADAIYVHCFRRTASWSSAQELTSVVFLEAWRRRRAVQLHGDCILPWLLAVANNAIRNADRSLRRNKRLLAKLPPPCATGDFGDDAAGRLTTTGVGTDTYGSGRAPNGGAGGCCSLRLGWLELYGSCYALDVPVGTVRPGSPCP